MVDHATHVLSGCIRWIFEFKCNGILSKTITIAKFRQIDMR